jgi:hypothetical protein
MTIKDKPTDTTTFNRKSEVTFSHKTFIFGDLRYLKHKANTYLLLWFRIMSR